MTVRLRPALVTDAGAIARVHVTAWWETYAGLIPSADLARLSVESRARFWRGWLDDPPWSSTLLLVEDGVMGVLGFGVCGPERAGVPAYRGEFQAIYLVRAGQGRGLGRSLMVALAAALLAQDMPSASVWVLRDNTPARRFYERLGGQPAGERTLELGEAALDEVSYGWLDVAGSFTGDGPC